MAEKEKRTSKKNVDGRSTSSHDNKKSITRSMEKQRGMAFGFRKTATAVKKPDIEDSFNVYYNIPRRILFTVIVNISTFYYTCLISVTNIYINNVVIKVRKCFFLG